MARLPVVGGDRDNWGQVLNEYLSVEHNSDGSLKLRTDGSLSNNIADGSVTASKLSASVNSYLASAQTAVQSVNGKTGQAVTLTASDVSAVSTSAAGAASGVATLDGSAKLTSTQVPDGVGRSAEIMGAPATNLGATPSINLTGKPHVWHLGTLNANATLSVTGFAEGHRLELHYIQDATGGRSLSIDDGSGAVAVNIPNTAGASVIVVVQWVTATEARISTPGDGLDAGTGLLLWHNAGQVVTDTNNVRSLLTFDAGAAVGSPTCMTKSATGITLTKPAVVIVQASMYTSSDIAHAGKKISWGVYDSVVNFDFIATYETIKPDGSTQSMVSWVYTPNEPDGAFPRPLRLWVAHDHASLELWGNLNVFVLNPNKLPQPQGI